MAGITVALVLIPQSMAYAQLAGLPAYYGLYAAFLPPMVAALFGSSRQLATGPVAVVSLLTAAALEPIATAGSEHYVAYAVLLALMVGMFQFALGALRLGVLVNFLSHPVVMGFTNAAAIIIATSQLAKIFGVTVEKQAHHYETVWDTMVAATTGTHLPTLLIAILAFAIMIGVKRVNPKLPGVLIAVVVTTLLAWMLSFEKLITVEMKQITDRTLHDALLLQREGAAEIDRLKTLLADSGPVSRVQIESELNAALDEQRARAKKFEHMELAVLPASADGKHAARVTLAEILTEGDQSDGRSWRFTDFDEHGNPNLRAGGRVVGNIPEGLPAMSTPVFDLQLVLQLIGSAVAISLIGFMEAISIAKAMATRTRQRLDANQELIGQGLANMVGSLFQSYPASGSFSRSAVNIGAGAVSGFSSVVTSAVVVIVLLWFTPLLYHLPQATLAAVIMMAVIGLVHVRDFKHTWKVYRTDGIIALTTFILTLLFAPHLDNAIIVGVMLSLGVFLYRTMKPRVALLSRYHDGTLRDIEVNKLESCAYVSVIRFDGSLYFANTGYFEDVIMQRSAEKPGLRYIIVDGQGMNMIDSTGEDMLATLTRRLNIAGITVYFTNFKRQVLMVLRNSGFMEQIGHEFFFAHTELAIDKVMDDLGEGHDIAECPLTIACVVETSDQPRPKPAA